jgi:predicted dehydrogenase
MQERSYTRNVDGVDEGPKTVDIQPANAHELAIADFVQAVLDDETPPITVVDGAKAVAICLAAIKSANTGSPVAPDYTGLE